MSQPKWFYSSGDRTMGPVDEQTLKKMSSEGTLRQQDLVCHEEKTKNQWVAAEKIKGLYAPVVAETVPVIHAPQPQAVLLGAVTCPTCRNQLLDAPHLRGQTVTCPHCRTPFHMAGNATAITPTSISPILACFLSFLIVGLGQMANGQIAKGVVLLIVTPPLAFFTGCFSLLITYPAVMIDAYLIAKKRREGRMVGEWESF